MTLFDALVLVGAAGWLVAVALWLLRYLHIFQIEEYSAGRTLRWVVQRHAFDLVGFGGALAVALAAVGLGARAPGLAGGLALAWGTAAALLALRAARRLPRPKKPLVKTARLKRIMGATALVIVLPLAAAVALGGPAFSCRAATLGFVAAALALLLPAVAGIGNTLLWPVEWVIQQRYLADARRILREVAPLVVGITGSYGKTSTKHALAPLLATGRRVLATPGSWNTLMGICKVIRSDLRREHEVFVVEMGAYRRGSIRRLTRFTPPRVGIVTCVGLAHLERFGTEENIRRAKFELVEALPQDGLAVLNGDDPTVRGYAAAAPCRAVLYGLNREAGPLDVWAEDLVVRPDGFSAWTLATADGRRVPCETPLLGRAAISNVLAALATCYGLGLDLVRAASAARTLRPAAHRLQLTEGGGGLRVLDDAYNSNPVGAAVALEVLAALGQDGQKFLITPGMIELGEREAELNRVFGQQAAAAADVVFLVGPERTRPIREGLLAAGFDPARIVVVAHLHEAQAELANRARPGDVVLYENDLPDNYTEQ